MGGHAVDAESFGADADQWFFVTGPAEVMFRTANDSYRLAAMSDPKAQGGIDHSGRVALVDADKHIRGYYNGTSPEDMKKLMSDIELLLHEKK